MHDHSRFQRDIDDVTGVSLSLSLLLTKVTLLLLFYLIGNPTGLSWPNNRDSEIFLQILPESVQRRS